MSGDHEKGGTKRLICPCTVHHACLSSASGRMPRFNLRCDDIYLNSRTRS